MSIYELWGCWHVKFHPRMKSTLSMMKCLLPFTRFGQDEVSTRNELIPVKKAGMKFHSGMKKKMYKHFMCKPNFTMSIFLLNFWRMYSTFFPTLICLNIMKVTRKIFWGLFTESKARKIIFFVQFYKTLFLSLLWSFMYHIECKISDIYFIFHFSVKFIPTIDTIDLSYFY